MPNANRIRRILKRWVEQPFLELYEPSLVHTLALGFVNLNPVPPILNLGPRTFIITAFRCCFRYVHDRETAKKVQDIVFNNPAFLPPGNTSSCVPACRIAGRIQAAGAGRSRVCDRL